MTRDQNETLTAPRELHAGKSRSRGWGWNQSLKMKEWAEYSLLALALESLTREYSYACVPACS